MDKELHLFVSSQKVPQLLDYEIVNPVLQDQKGKHHSSPKALRLKTSQ